MTSLPSPLVARFIRRYTSAYSAGSAQVPGGVAAGDVSAAQRARAPK